MCPPRGHQSSQGVTCVLKEFPIDASLVSGYEETLKQVNKPSLMPGQS